MEEDEDRKREGCAVGVLSCLVSDCGMLSALYNGSDACPLLELVTMASTWLSSRSMVDWSGLSPSGENAADTRCTAVCTGYVAPGENTTKTAMSYSSLLSLSLNFLLLSFLFIFQAIVVGLENSQYVLNLLLTKYYMVITLFTTLWPKTVYNIQMSQI